MGFVATSSKQPMNKTSFTKVTKKALVVKFVSLMFLLRELGFDKYRAARISQFMGDTVNIMQ